MNWKTMRRLAAAILICNVTITSSVLLDTNTHNYKLQKENVSFSFKAKESKHELIAKAINNNISLNDVQKRELMKLKDYILENPYVNEKYILYCLENFKIEKASKDDLEEIGADAYYDAVSNTIYVNEKNYGIFHEGLHMLTDYSFDLKEISSISNLTGQNIFVFYNERDKKMACTGLWDAKRDIGRGLNEGLTALLAHEYFGEFKYIYQFEQTFVRMLCEIVDPNKVLEAYSKANIDILIEELIKINGDEKQAIEFIKEIDSLYYIEQLPEEDSTYEENQIHISKALEILDKYHTAKNGIPLNENKIMLTYNFEMYDLQGYGFQVVKGYFSSKYKENIGEPYIIFDTAIITFEELENPQYCKNKTN